MGKVEEILLDGQMRSRVADDCVALIDSEVASKKGATGLVIKAGYRSFKSLKPGIVEAAVNHLLPRFALIMDRYFEEFTSQKALGGFSGWLAGMAETVAEDLLAITDEVVANSEIRSIKPIYSGLRKMGKNNVAAAVPAMGRLITKYTEPQ